MACCTPQRMATAEAPVPLQSRPPWPYRCLRWFFGFLTNIWFREISVVDDEYLPNDAGVVFVSWHPNGLIDPMLMTAQLPYHLNTFVQHRAFDLPLVSKLTRNAGLISLRQFPASARQRNATLLHEAAMRVARGGHLLMFPEEASHGEAGVQRVRSGVARVMLAACLEASANGRPLPYLVPVGLHYSDSHQFRERAALVFERPMALPPLPESGQHGDEASVHREWVVRLTEAIQVELSRASHSTTSWTERTLIWKGRSIVYAEKKRAVGQPLAKPTYADSVLGARRLRAGWEFMHQHDSETTEDLARECEDHFQSLDHRRISPLDVDTRPTTLSPATLVRLVLMWLWAAVWMLGLVTWGAIIGNYVPYKATGVVDRIVARFNDDDSLRGSMKVITALVLFPLWWLLLSGWLTYTMLGETSGVRVAMASHWLLVHLTTLPPAGLFLAFLIAWPLAARGHLRLYARLSDATQSLRRWRRWRDETKDWDQLVQTQRHLAQRLVGLGTNLVLPGDEDWVDPPSGQDDASMVRVRTA